MEEIKINHITKIEGHSKLHLKYDKKTKKVKVCELDVFESPRYFEALIKNRDCKEVPYLAGRICGICNVAHLTGSILAVEDALDLKVSEQTKKLRELMLLGAMFHSHVLQLYFLALPDYLGYSSALDMKGSDLKLLERCMNLKEIGNDIVNVIGGRSMHPLTPTLGGFRKLPSNDEMTKLLKKLKSARKDAMDTVKLFSSIDSPGFERKNNFLSLKSDVKYPFMGADVGTSFKESFGPEKYPEKLKEMVMKHSTSKHVTLKGQSYMVGPLARININSKNLKKDARDLFEGETNDIFYANTARALETLHCIDRSIEILEELEIKNEKIREIKYKNCEGVSATEAPRGILFHRYKINKDGKVTFVDIIPPTTQNVLNMEDSIREILPKFMDNPKKKIRIEIEKLIRAYDPCFSCSAHFLDLNFI